MFVTLAIAFGIATSHAAVAVEERELQSMLDSVGSPVSEVRQTAIRQLLDPRLRNQIKPHSEDLIPRLTDYADNESSAELLGLLDLPGSLKSDVLVSPTVPDRVKARLGDEAAEVRTIERFHAARPFNRMIYAERDLLYIDSRRSLVALIEELNSREFHVDRFGNQVSVTQMMIQAYGRVHYDVELFQPETYLPHCYTSEEEFQAPEHQAYLHAVGEYFSGMVGRPVKVDVPFLIKGSERIEKFQVSPANESD